MDTSDFTQFLYLDNAYPVLNINDDDLKFRFVNWESKTFSNSGSVLGVTLVENLNLSFLDLKITHINNYYISVGILQVSNDVVNQVSSVSVAHDLSVKSSWLSEIAVRMLGNISLNQTSDLNFTKIDCYYLEWSNVVLFVLERSTEGVGFVVGS